MSGAHGRKKQHCSGKPKQWSPLSLWGRGEGAKRGTCLESLAVQAGGSLHHLLLLPAVALREAAQISGPEVTCSREGSALQYGLYFSHLYNVRLIKSRG